jgi:hypothetical protein
MRIVAWNCCRGPFDRKLAALGTLRPDVAVIAEALAPEEENDRVLWFPSNASRLGVQVRAFGRNTLRRLEAASGLPNCVVPVQVAGPRRPFNLLAVWTWPAPSYVKAFLNGLEAYGELLRSGPTVVAGDFNGNPVFDRPTQRNKWWTQGFARLSDAGLVSAYHEFNGVPYGGEPHATHHFLRKPERPFHIDYCFIPRAWSSKRLAVQVAAQPPWPLLSDHFPLIVDTVAS